MRRYSRDQNVDGTPYIRIVPLYSASGDVEVESGSHRIYNDTGTTLTIVSVRASVTTAPVGSGITVDVKKDGVSLWSVQGDRPTIPAGQTTVKATNMTTTTWEDGTYLIVDVVSVGSTTPGAGLVIQVATA